MSDEDVREILRIIDESELDELRLETEGFSLHVLRGGAPAAEPARPRVTEPPPDGDGAPTSPPASTDNGAQTISAPMLGTFYRAEAPGAQPLVEIGARVEPDTTVCLIEVMKMMNSIPAGMVGTIVEICAENAALVEYGAPLFRVQPS